MTIKDSVGTSDEEKVLKEVFPTLESQSVDYGIMEKASESILLPVISDGMMLVHGLL